MTPYYQDNSVTLYHGDAREVLPALVGVCALIADPPYGINYSINARSWQNDGLTALKPWKMEKKAPIVGDERPFDVRPFLPFSKVALFGANHYEHLPIGGKWIVWDKRRDSTPDDHPDCELVWTNVPGADRIHRQKWRGIVREGEENCSRSRKLHPNQKPVALLSFIFDELHIRPGEVICDPFLGSGSTGVVALRRNCPFIGIDIDEGCCELAATRLSAEATQ